ncbi:hypothetical protein MTO96_021378 [Rhipicephalus appendiculatus]
MLRGRPGEAQLAVNSEHRLPVGVGGGTLEEEVVKDLEVTADYADRTTAPGVAMATFGSVIIPPSEAGGGIHGPIWIGP